MFTIKEKKKDYWLFQKESNSLLAEVTLGDKCFNSRPVLNTRGRAVIRPLPRRVPAGRAGGSGRSACRARLCTASSGLERAQLLEGLTKVVMRGERAGKARGKCLRVAASCSRPQQG